MHYFPDLQEVNQLVAKVVKVAKRPKVKTKVVVKLENHRKRQRKVVAVVQKAVQAVAAVQKAVQKQEKTNKHCVKKKKKL